MFCLASRYQASPDSLSRVAQIFREQAVPLLSGAQVREGFQVQAHAVA